MQLTLVSFIQEQDQKTAKITPSTKKHNA